MFFRNKATNEATVGASGANRDEKKTTVCAKCGKPLNQDDAFCRMCGSKCEEKEYNPMNNSRFSCIYGPPPVKRLHTCKDCGFSWSTRLMIDNERFCPKCGASADIKEESDSPQRILPDSRGTEAAVTKSDQYLIAVDLEGIHGVVGEPYIGLKRECADYKVAVENAVDEINAVVRGLFDGGARLVAVWDNHGRGSNLDFSRIDSRVIQVTNQGLPIRGRLALARDYSFDGILFIGYHAKEGSLNGVLAHSYNSTSIQYYKVNGRQVGELDIDSWAAAEQGIAPLFCSSDQVAVAQALEIEPEMQTVITKLGTGRNSAQFRDKEELLAEMYEKAKACTKLNPTPKRLELPAKLELRVTRSEDAKKKLEKALGYGMKIEYGEDNHVLVGTIESLGELEGLL